MERRSPSRRAPGLVDLALLGIVVALVALPLPVLLDTSSRAFRKLVLLGAFVVPPALVLAYAQRRFGPRAQGGVQGISEVDR